MRIISALVLAIAVTLTVASAASSDPGDITSTIVNRNDDGHQVVKTDHRGNAVDAHDGDLLEVDGVYYLYGTSYDCGYGLQVTGTKFCGFKVYRSTDLVVWTDQGQLFDATTPEWQARCAPPTYGCYRPHVLWNETTQKYVLWVNGYWAGNMSGYMVLVSSSPTGPFTEVGEASVHLTGANAGGFSNGDHDLFVDDDGTAYIVYTRIHADPSHSLIVEKLNYTYTAGTGQYVVVGATKREAPSMFKRNGVYYILYSNTCPYCNHGAAYTRAASTPLGTWSSETQISMDSCGGQTSFVTKIGDEYLLGVDLWKQSAANQALANYHWVKLSFPVTTVDCSPTQQLTLAGSKSTLAVDAGVDVSSGEYAFKTHCDVKSIWSRMQTFVPMRNGILTKVSIGTYKSGAVNVNLAIDIVRVNSAGQPVGPVLGTRAIAHSSIGSSMRMYDFGFDVDVLAGNRYGMILRSPTTVGCFGIAYNDYQTYAMGFAGYRSTSGSWVAETTRSLKFATYVS